jgi:MFS family permease
LVGRASDRFGKFPTFCSGTAISVIMVVIWTNIGHLPLTWVIVINVLLFAGIFSRMIPAQALVSAIPGPTQRGAFNAVSASLQQLAGGISSGVAGLIIVQTSDGPLEHFDWLGYIVVAVALVSVVLMYFVHEQVPEVTPR